MTTWALGSAPKLAQRQRRRRGRWRQPLAPSRRSAPQTDTIPRPWPAVLSDAVPLVLSRTLLMAFAQSLQQLAPDVQQAVAT